MALIVFTTFTMLTPPPELIATLLDGAPFRSNQIHERDRWLIEEAYKAGADQELKACCEYLTRCASWEPEDVQEFCGLRRPKPPSLKERALKALETEENDLSVTAASVIRRALEALDE